MYVYLKDSQTIPISKHLLEALQTIEYGQGCMRSDVTWYN